MEKEDSIEAVIGGRFAALLVAEVDGLDEVLSTPGAEWNAANRLLVMAWLEEHAALFHAAARRTADGAIGLDPGGPFGEETWAEFRKDAKHGLARCFVRWTPPPVANTPGRDLRSRFVWWVIGRAPAFSWYRDPSGEEHARLLRLPAAFQAYAWRAANKWLKKHGAELPDGVSSGPPPDDVDLETTIWAAVLGLTDDQRLAIELIHLRGLERFDASVVAGTSYGALRKQRTKALQRLLPLIRWFNAQDLALASILGGATDADLAARTGMKPSEVRENVEEGRRIVASKLTLALCKKKARPEDRAWLAELRQSPLAVARVFGAIPSALLGNWERVRAQIPELAKDLPVNPSSTTAGQNLRATYERVRKARLDAALAADRPKPGDVPGHVRSGYEKVITATPSDELVQRTWLMLAFRRERMHGTFFGHEALVDAVLRRTDPKLHPRWVLAAYLLGRKKDDVVSALRQDAAIVDGWVPHALRDGIACAEGVRSSWADLEDAFDALIDRMESSFASESGLEWPFELPATHNASHEALRTNQPKEALSRLLREINGSLVKRPWL